MGRDFPLYQRLKYLKTSKKQNIAKQSGSDEKRIIPELTLSEWEKHSPYVWKKVQYTPNDVIRGGIGSLYLIPSLDNAVFLDIETTGLSGGAGTIAFLVGIGTIEGNNIKVEQYFLADYPGEKEFLDSFRHYLSQDRYFITYNGKSFDMNILFVRYMMHRIAVSFPLQCDLLHFSRKLWKTILPNCTLSSIEERVLNRPRINDLPGNYAPQAYFQFLKTGREDELQKIIEHNYRDVITLTELFTYIERALFEPTKIDNINQLELAKMLLQRDRKKGEKVLHQLMEEGMFKAGELLGLYYKKRREWQRSLQVWKQVFSEHKSFHIGTELAKYYEHQEKDYEKALSYVRELFALPLIPDHRKELVHRKKRLEAKLYSMKLHSGRRKHAPSD